MENLQALQEIITEHKVFFFYGRLLHYLSLRQMFTELRSSFLSILTKFGMGLQTLTL